MSKLYKKNMLEILEILDIPEPDWIASDQKQITNLVELIKGKLEDYNPPDPPVPPVYSQLPTPVLEIDGNLRMTVVGAAAMQDLWDKVSIVDEDDEFIGYATMPVGQEAYYDLYQLITGAGAFEFKAKYEPADGVTLADSDYGELTGTALGVTHAFTDCVEESMRTAAIAGKDYVGQIGVDTENFSLPLTITVEVGEDSLTDGFTYNATTGAYTVDGAHVTDALTITAVAVTKTP